MVAIINLCRKLYGGSIRCDYMVFESAFAVDNSNRFEYNYKVAINILSFRGVAQFGSAPALGLWCRFHGPVRRTA